jgi:hypothetical protein
MGIQGRARMYHTRETNKNIAVQTVSGTREKFLLVPTVVPISALSGLAREVRFFWRIAPPIGQRIHHFTWEKNLHTEVCMHTIMVVTRLFIYPFSIMTCTQTNITAQSRAHVHMSVPAMYIPPERPPHTPRMHHARTPHDARTH